MSTNVSSKTIHRCPVCSGTLLYIDEDLQVGCAMCGRHHDPRQFPGIDAQITTLRNEQRARFLERDRARRERIVAELDAADPEKPEEPENLYDLEPSPRHGKSDRYQAVEKAYRGETSWR